MAHCTIQACRNDLRCVDPAIAQPNPAVVPVPGPVHEAGVHRMNGQCPHSLKDIHDSWCTRTRISNVVSYIRGTSSPSKVRLFSCMKTYPRSALPLTAVKMTGIARLTARLCSSLNTATAHSQPIGPHPIAPHPIAPTMRPTPDGLTRSHANIHQQPKSAGPK